MSSMRYCCLCCKTCDEYKLLQNDFGESNSIYEITVKYFDPMLLTEYGNSKSQHTQAICQSCWFHINEFHEFQQAVLKTRLLWEDKELKSSHIQVKPEDDQADVNKQIPNNGTWEKSEDDDDPFDEYQDFKTESFAICEDTLEPLLEEPNEKDKQNCSPLGEYKNEEKNIKTKMRRGKKRKDEDDPFDEYQDFRTESFSICEDTLEPLLEEPNEKDKQNCSPLGEYKNEEKNIRTKMRKKRKNMKDSNPDECYIEDNKKSKKSKLTDSAKEKGNSAFNLEKARESDAFIAEWKPELVCDLCSDTATNFDKLRIHFKEKHKTRFYVKCCDRKFFRRCVLVNHIQLHLNPETHKCDICGKSSSTKHNLKLHKKVMHEDTKQLKCEICGKLFKQKVTLERHLLTHATGSKDFICSECGKGYVVEQLLKLHIKHVHNVDRVCDQCGKTIHGFQALKKHLMEHAGIERPKFPCDVCGLELTSPTGLKRHKDAYHNDGSTIYVCGVCGKVAASQNALWNHKILVHVEERKHKCTYCDKAFKRPKSLREHIATHTGQDLYQCPHCPQTFKVSANMHHHRKRVHPVEWEEGRKNRLQQPKINTTQVKKQIVIW